MQSFELSPHQITTSGCDFAMYHSVIINALITMYARDKFRTSKLLWIITICANNLGLTQNQH